MLTQHDIISKLKLQPRHGAITPPSQDPNQKINIDISDVAGAISNLTLLAEVTLDAKNALSELNNASAKNAGIAKYQSIIRKMHADMNLIITDTLTLEKRNTDLQKSFGISTVAASKLGVGLDAIAHAYGLAGTHVRTYASNIKSLLPLLNQQKASDNTMYKNMVLTQDILQTNLGLTGEQTNAYTAYAMQQGDNALQTLRASKALTDALDPEGTMGYFKMATQGIADAGEEIQLQYGKIPGNLELAVIKANRFGLSLSKLKATADNLLNIESSIGQELEYQLLSGRRLVNNQGKSLTNAYREATLRGNAVDQANILNEIIETEGETLTNNLFARKQMASLLGMEEQQLASALQKRNILEKAAAKGMKINIDDEGALAAAAAQLKETGDITAEEFKKFKETSDTRTTEQLLAEMVHLQEEQLFVTQLANQDILIAAAKEGAKDTIKELNTTVQKLNAANLEASGKSVIVQEAVRQNEAIIDELADLASGEMPVKTPVQAIPDTGIGGGTAAVTNQPAGMADGGVVPPGYPNDTYPALLTSGETVVPADRPIPLSNNSNDFMKFASMIVNAINQQTIALREKPGTMNTSRFA